MVNNGLNKKTKVNHTSESTITISACSDLLGVPTNQRSVILTASLSVSFDPLMFFILYGIRAIILHKTGATMYNLIHKTDDYMTTTNTILA